MKTSCKTELWAKENGWVYYIEGYVVGNTITLLTAIIQTISFCQL